MAKTINPSHITGERGVIRLADYCNQHEPYLIFRPSTVSDFGIDGEIELTEIDANNKTTPKAEIIKVQIKSTAKDNSYIKRETEVSFEFHAKQDDIDYWTKYGQYGIKVLLVIFDDRCDKLYCKEISNIDLASAKKSYPIEFSKIDNLLEKGKHNFTHQYAKSFTNRINYNVEETLIFNLYPFKSFPRLLYVYQAKYNNKKSIHELVAENETPYFAIYGGKIYSFMEIDKKFDVFSSAILKNPIEKDTLDWNSILASINLKNIYIEVINLYIKAFMGSKGLKFSKDFHRFFFKIKEEQTERKAKYTTRKQKKTGEITVVNKYDYGKDTFYRHHAVEIKIIWIEDRPYLLLNHQWFFTKNKKTPLNSDLISKYSIGINNKLHNKELLDLQQFWWSHLAWNNETKSDNEMIIFDGVHIRQSNIIVGRAIKKTVPFGIPTDGEKEFGTRKTTNIASDYVQPKLFEL